MSVLLSSVMGGNGSFEVTFSSPTVIIPTSTTVDTVITPPPGERVRLVSLASGGASQTNLTSVTIGLNNVVSLVNLQAKSAPADAANEFNMGFGDANQSEITGGVGVDLEIKTDVATSQPTLYTYQFGI